MEWHKKGHSVQDYVFTIIQIIEKNLQRKCWDTSGVPRLGKSILPREPGEADVTKEVKSEVKPLNNIGYKNLQSIITIECSFVHDKKSAIRVQANSIKHYNQKRKNHYRKDKTHGYSKTWKPDNVWYKDRENRHI